jgi:hypothetical protein
MSEDVIELLIYHQPGVKPSLTLRPFGVLGYVAGHSLTKKELEKTVKNLTNIHQNCDNFAIIAASQNFSRVYHR